MGLKPCWERKPSETRLQEHVRVAEVDTRSRLGVHSGKSSCASHAWFVREDRRRYPSLTLPPRSPKPSMLNPPHRHPPRTQHAKPDKQSETESQRESWGVTDRWVCVCVGWCWGCHQDRLSMLWVCCADLALNHLRRSALHLARRLHYNEGSPINVCGGGRTLERRTGASGRLPLWPAASKQASKQARVCVCVYVCMYVCMYVCICIYIYIYIYIYTYTHI